MADTVVDNYALLSTLCDVLIDTKYRPIKRMLAWKYVCMLSMRDFPGSTQLAVKLMKPSTMFNVLFRRNNLLNVLINMKNIRR